MILEPEDRITVREACQLTGFSRHVIIELYNSGEIKGYRRTPRSMVYLSRKSVYEYLKILS